MSVNALMEYKYTNVNKKEQTISIKTFKGSLTNFTGYYFLDTTVN